MPVFIAKCPEIACDVPFKNSKTALKYAEEHAEELDPSDSGYMVIKQHSQLFLVEKTTKTYLVFTNRETVETT